MMNISGNDVIHKLTKGENSSLYISITFQNDTTLYKVYKQFYLSDEKDKYRLLVTGGHNGSLRK
jgi:hypothetical protein